MWTRIFWKDTVERTVSTAAQAALAMLSADGLGVLDVDWADVGSVSGLAAILAVLKALVAAKTVDNTISPASLVTDTPGKHAADRDLNRRVGL